MTAARLAVRRRSTRPPRGFALLIVLWTTGLLALIGTQVTAAGRTEARLASNLRGSAIAEAAADAAVQEAAIRLLKTPAAAKIDGPATLLRLPQAAVEVAIESESRKLPLNTAPLPAMAVMLKLLGANQPAALAIATQIADWRNQSNVPQKAGAKAAEYKAAGRGWGPPSRPFRSLEEVGLVLGMTPQLLARMAPHVSVYTQSLPKPAVADPVVVATMRAMSAEGVQPVAFDEAPVYRVTAVARAAGGGQFIRRAVIRLNTSSDAGAPTRAIDVLSWAEGPAGPIPD